ncbi:DUF5336 domain-containing protein [Streptomyces sp. NK15101]|uniref:DUF5336 domain-containing protein n=1 Tax=Streptomyces sp. NK15101 TaxID=2873261 RepID=UPI001CECC01D|nr:DUF5336 domain-containing protein [Streptomyces sp. NK15101]
MNIRSLTRGDGVLIGAAVLLFIASFLDFFSYKGLAADAPSAWESLGNAIGVYMVGIIGAALIILTRALPQPRKVVGLDLGQFGVAATIFTAWSLFWTIIDLGGVDAGAGLILGLIAALILAGAAVAGPLVPALKAPLVGAPSPQSPTPYGMQHGQPGQPGVPGGYGYPGAQQPQYGGPQDPSQGAGQPFGAQAVAPQPQAAQQPEPQAAAPAAQPASDFAPFWFAVPVARPLYAEDGSQAPIAELAPGTWYLAVEQRGPGLVAQTQDGRRGVLQDTTGIQRG